MTERRSLRSVISKVFHWPTELSARTFGVTPARTEGGFSIFDFRFRIFALRGGGGESGREGERGEETAEFHRDLE